MKIYSVRAGFATNSSSTHSVVIIPKENVGTIKQREPSEKFTYGWEDFVLTDSENKLAYLASQINSSLYNNLDAAARVKLIKDITGIDLTDAIEYTNSNEVYVNATVDHQSVWNFNGFDIVSDDYISFMNDLKEYILKDEVIILGGNDSSDGNPYKPAFSRRYTKLESITGSDCCSSGRMIRKDGDYYTFYSKGSGTKVRLSLKDNVKPYRKSSTPELVDLKITQYCQYGCKFCYMGSTKSGLHANLDDIKRYVDHLAELKVMEIALGGGEPTTHPNFVEILKYIDSKGITVNFTTFSVAWLTNSEILETVINCVSAVGVSVLNEKDLNKVVKISKALESKSHRKKVQVMAQHVLGSIDAGETSRILISCWEKYIPVLLLGFKKTGFGKTYKQHPVDDILGIIKMANTKSGYYGVTVNFLSVDTAFVNKFKKFLKELGVSSKLITSPEGKFSMYIDAVENKIAPSSYCNDKKFSTAPKTAEELKKVFQTY